jgi:hypothetical protein
MESVGVEIESEIARYAETVRDTLLVSGVLKAAAIMSQVCAPPVRVHVGD